MKTRTLTLFCLAILAFAAGASAKVEEPSKTNHEKINVAVLYTAESNEKAEVLENLSDVARFAIDQYDLEHHTKSEINLIPIDDRDDPQDAVKKIKSVAESQKLSAIIGPIYSNVALGLKDYVTEAQIPLISIFATHNDLTKNSNFIFRICASNRRLVKTMADFLIPEVKKRHLNVTAFKDLSDDYSTDLADNFKVYASSIRDDYNEVLFRGISGIDHLRDINSKIWTPNKKHVIFLPDRDLVAGHILAALEAEPYMVAAIDTVDFTHLMSHLIKEKTHIRIVTTSQWLPQKSEYSKKIEEAFKNKFHRQMTISSALTYDAAYTLTSALQRTVAGGVPLVQTLRDGTKLNGVTGSIFIGHDGERVFSDQFIKEDVIE